MEVQVLSTASNAGAPEGGVQSSALARNLRSRRLALGLTQETLAVHAGVTRSTVMRIELDSPFKPRLDSLEKLAAYLGCGVGDLFAEPDNGDEPEPDNGDEPEPGPKRAVSG